MVDPMKIGYGKNQNTSQMYIRKEGERDARTI